MHPSPSVTEERLLRRWPMAEQNVPDTPIRPLLVTPAQAAALLNVGRTTLYYLTRDGELTAVHIGRATRYALSELEAYVRDRMMAPPGATRRLA
jgi:excisionase family DNA binding protein